MPKHSVLNTRLAGSVSLLPLVSAGILLTPPAPGAAQESGNLSVEVGDCVKLPARADRLACYERRVNEAVSEKHRSSSAASPAESAATSGPKASAETAPPRTAEFGRLDTPEASPSEANPPEASPSEANPPERSPREASPPEARDERGARVEEAKPRPATEAREFRATIAALRKRLPNQYVITLDNGQTWLQSPPEIYPLRVGDEVRLYPTRWGEAYRLSVAKLKGFIQVERVQ